MEKSSFFNAILDAGGNPDRSYLAEDFARYFNSFIGNGVFPNPSTGLQVMANDNMTITILKGKAWINGYFYENTDDLIFTLDPADGVLNRIDRVVLELDYDGAREIKAVIKSGNFASSPSPKDLQRDADAYELALADIYVGKGIVSINQGNITDLRLDNDLCGVVHGVIDQVDVTTLFNQYTQGFELRKEEFEQAFYQWFDTLQDVLDENTASNLLNMINNVSDNLEGLENDLESHKADNASQALLTRQEILDIKLKLSESQVYEFLNKTGIGFYDLFTSVDYVNTSTTTANVDLANNKVKFTGSKSLVMKEQQFANFTDAELAVYDLARKTIKVEKASTTNKIEILIEPGGVGIGDRFMFGNEVYNITSIEQI